MANFTYTNALEQIMLGAINFSTDDIRVLLVMTNTTADTENDIPFIGSIVGSLDEHDGANYARQALAGEGVSEDTVNDYGIFDANDFTISTLGIGTRAIAAAMVYKHVTNDADSIPLFYIDSGFSTTNSNGSDYVVQWHADGIARLKNAV